MSASRTASHTRNRFLPRFSKRDLLEGAIIAVAFLLYFWVRGAVVDNPEKAYWHARDIIDVERTMHIFVEGDMNRWVTHHHWLAQVLNYTYFYLHFPLIIVFGIWAYYYRRDKYTFIRDSFLASGAIALVIYFLYPVAPPRALPELAAQYDAAAPAYVHQFVDTMKQYLGYAYDTQSTDSFVNPYAAMPSLHFGWDLLLGIAIINCFRGTRSDGGRVRFSWLAILIGALLPASQILAITMTANHFFLDALAGGIVALAGLAIAHAMQRWTYPWLHAQLRQFRRAHAPSA